MSSTGEMLRAKYGAPEKVPTADALRWIGKRDEVHPRDAVAFRYPSHEAAEAFAAVNAEHHGVPNLGILETAEGWIGVLDLRPQLMEHGSPVTYPELPDNWAPSQRQ